jgi:hypothetical protein
MPGSSRFTGVTWEESRGRWKVQFRRRHVGRFESEEDAARAYDALVLEEYGEEDAYLNFPVGW